MSIFKVLAVVVTALASASTALAQPMTQHDRENLARHYYSAGVQAYESENWLLCAERFEQSFTLVFAPEILYNIGRCYERYIGEQEGEVAYQLYDRAIAAYTRYLTDSPDAADADDIREDILRLRAARPDPGLQRASHVPDPEPEEAVAPPEEEVVLPSPQPEVTVDPVDPVISSALTVEPAPGPEFILTPIAGAATAAALVAAIALGVAAQNRFSDLERICAQGPDGCSDADIAGMHSMADSANILYITAGVLGAGTGALFALEYTGVF